MSEKDVGDGDPIEAWLRATGGAAPAAAPDAAAAEPSGQRTSLSRRLVLLSVLPWIAVALLGATALQRQVPTAPATRTPSAAPTDEAAADQPSDPPAASGPEAPNGDAVADAAEAAAVVAVRMAAADNEYLDTVAVEGRTTAGALTIVTVRAVRLLHSDGAWGEPQIIRAAVATAEVDGETVAVTSPWRLPPPGSAAAPQWRPVDDPALLDAATATVRAAGYRRLGEPELRRADALGDLLSLAVTAAGPGDADLRPHEILMTADATAVLGTSAADPLPIPLPAEQP